MSFQFPQMFDATQVEPAGMSSQLPISGPEGLPAIITASEMVASKNNANNGFLALTVQIIEGEHTGTTGTYRLNLYHDNAKTVEIAYKQLSAVCHATGQFKVANSAQLHNIPFRIVTGYQKLTKDQEEAKSRGEEVTPFTEVKGVLAMDGSQPGKPKNGAQAAAAPQPAPTPAPVQNAAPAANAAAPATPAPWGAAAAAPVEQAQPAAGAQPWSQNPTAATEKAPWQQ